MAVSGWRCATCFTELPVSAAMPFRCPNATADDPRHVLQIVSAGVDAGSASTGNPFIDYDARFAWSAYAHANGMDATARAALVTELDDAVRSVDGVGFRVTPFHRSVVLSDELGFDPDPERGGGVWVKDETGGVGGSQKARFLFSILLHLRTLEELGQLTERPPLAIASCGNAALAAATLARAADWPIDVFVPMWMSDGFGVRLDELGARVHRSARRDDDPPGDPAMLRFRDAVQGGAVPFTVQGPENALCLDGGRTLGWEICDQLDAAGTGRLDRIFIQVGGGAFAAAVGSALQTACGPVPLMAVQTEGCAPLARAWERAAGVEHVAGAWSELMTVWDDPTSVADGILDDETYDWVGIFDVLRASGGSPIVAAEPLVVEAHELAHRAGFDASATGTAGLAGLLSARDELADTERVAVVMSGVTR